MFGILGTCVYSYHVWWRRNKIRNNFPTKTEAGKINWLNEGTLSFLFFKNIFGNGTDIFITTKLFMSRPVSSVGRASDF